MCGIFGVRGHADAVALTKLGLFSLQHRGQESAGIVAVENGAARAVRSMGLVSDMPLAPLDALHGEMAIGHDMEFFSLDMVNTCWTRSFYGVGGTVFLLCQTTGADAEDYEPALRGIGASMRQEE